MKVKSLLTASAIALVAVMMIGCSSSSNSPSGQGEVRIYMVDSPASYEQVNIVVTKVEVHSSGSDSTSGWATIVDTTRTFDLLELRNGANALLGDRSLPPGHYTQIRLSIGTGSNVMIAGITYPLDISANNTLKLNHEFDIQSGQVYSITLDFDADHSIVVTGNLQYKLKPVIRVVATLQTGSISGAVSPVAARAIASVEVNSDTVSAFCDTLTGAFMIQALPAGTYDLEIKAQSLIYGDTTITGVVVTAQNNTNVGLITLHSSL